MPEFFPPTQVTWAKYADVEGELQDGWIAQYRGYGYLSGLVQHGTGGCHSHSAMLCRVNGHVDVMELREFIGGRRQPLEGHVERWPGQIDVFSINRARFPEFNARGAVRYMRGLTARPYGYLGVSRLALRHVPLLWRFWPLVLQDYDVLATRGAPFCSHAVCTACRVGGGVDPVPRKADHLVSPNDLTWSLLFQYEFTLTP